MDKFPSFSSVKVVVFSLISGLFLPQTTGVASFGSPVENVEAKLGLPVTLKWTYAVGNRVSEFSSYSPTWEFYNETSGSWLEIASEFKFSFPRWNWSVSTATCPPGLRDRLQKASSPNAGLYITNVTKDDYGKYRCVLQLTSGDPIPQILNLNPPAPTTVTTPVPVTTTAYGTTTSSTPKSSTTTSSKTSTTSESTAPSSTTGSTMAAWVIPVGSSCGGLVLVLIVILSCYCCCSKYLFKCCDYFCCCCPKAVRDWFHHVCCDRCRDCCGVCCCCCAKYIKNQEHEMKPLPADSTGAPPAATTAVSPAAPPAASTAASNNRSE